MTLYSISGRENGLMEGSNGRWWDLFKSFPLSFSLQLNSGTIHWKKFSFNSNLLHSKQSFSLPSVQRAVLCDSVHLHWVPVQNNQVLHKILTRLILYSPGAKYPWCFQVFDAEQLSLVCQNSGYMKLKSLTTLPPCYAQSIIGFVYFIIVSSNFYH